MKTIEVLRKLNNETSAKIYITGGFVRDCIRRRPNRDLDIVARGMDLTKIARWLIPYGKTKILEVHRVEGTEPIQLISFVAKDDDLEAQISLAKGKGKLKNNVYATLKQDGSFRDFSINAMYLPINNISPKSVIDYFGGKNDIAARQLLTVGPAKRKFNESPIRIMRAFSLGARLNYTIANHTQAGILECANLLKKASWEAIRMELEDILLSKKPSKYLKLMEKLGVLKIVMPELQRCVNCNQDKRYHKHDVFNHVLNACDNIEPNLTLRLAALLHDIGKPSSRKIIDGKVTFHKHEVLGAKEAAILLKRLKFDKETIKEVTHLIRMHMYHYTREWTDSGIRRFIENAPIKEEDLKDIGNIPLFKLRKSDRAGNGYRKQPVTDRQRDFEDRIIKVFGSSNGFTIKDLDINGDILMEYFNLTPGKQIGEILNYLLGVILEYPELNERRELLNAALYFIVNKKEKKKKEEK